MTKLTLNDLGSFQSSLITTVNNNNTITETAFENTLSRDGTSPNSMGSALDMNSYKILNLGYPVDPTDPIRLQDLEAALELITGIDVGAVTGTGNIVLSNSPTLVTPNLGTPSAIDLTHATNVPAASVSTLTGLGTNVATFLATPTSANLASAVVTNKTGSGALVFNNTPTFIAPLLGTPTSGDLSNCSGTASSLTAGHVTTNANLTGPITSTGNATAVAAQTGTGTTFVMNQSPALVTPDLGTPTALLGTNITGTAASLTAGHVTTNANLTGPITSSGNATSIASQTGTGTKFVVDTSPTLVTPVLGVATGTSLALGGGTALTTTNQTGTGSLVLQTSPSLTTPALGTPTAGVLSSCTGLPLTSGVTGVLPVANGGTNASSASITAFNNITGYTASGATGTTSTNLVFSASPTFTGTPVLSTATATSINKVAITAPATSATLTIADGKTHVVSNSITFTGTDSTSFAFPSTSSTVATLGAANTFTGANVFNGSTTTFNPSTGTGGVIINGPSGQTMSLDLLSATGQLAYIRIGSGTIGNGFEFQTDTSGNWVANSAGVANGLFQAIRSGAVANTLILTAGQIKLGAAASWSANGAVAVTSPIAATPTGPTGSHTSVQEWLTVVNSSGTVRYIPAF